MFVWNAPPGGDAVMIETAMAAKAIHEKMGANVFIGMDQRGRMHYGVSFENSAARGAFFDKIQTNEEFQALMDKASQGAKAATMKKAYNMTVAMGSGGTDGKVIMVFQYEPDPGRVGDGLAKRAEANASHDKRGAELDAEVRE